MTDIELWLEDEFGVDLSDEKEVDATLSYINQATMYFRNLPRGDEYHTYLHEAIYEQVEPLSYHQWIIGMESFDSHLKTIDNMSKDIVNQVNDMIGMSDEERAYDVADILKSHFQDLILKYVIEGLIKNGKM